MIEFVFACLIVVGLLIFLSSVDDLFVDLLRIGVRRRAVTRYSANEEEPKPAIAVFVANWHEADVLDAMVEGNLARISYRPLTFVLGVYPNDIETRQVAERLERKHPDRVQVVVNRRNGPTSKGQMLNEMFWRTFARPEQAPDIVVMHDSEDVIDPRSFDLYAERSRDHAFVQVPVFSLDSRHRSRVGATYMEEFAERHTGEMIVRDALGSFIPSAGVGTALRKDLIEYFLAGRGHVLDPGSVTEDYMLGVESHRAGFSTTFAAVKAPAGDGNALIATLEYFPRDFWAAVRQKTRWVHGIVFEGTQRLGWQGSAWDKYFLFRDRKGAITNLLPLVSLAMMLPLLVFGLTGAGVSRGGLELAGVVFTLNTLAIVLRFWVKVHAFRRVYRERDALGIAVRWFVAIFVNAFAVARAWRTFLVESRLASRPIAWTKTQHELPAAFGRQASTLDAMGLLVTNVRVADRRRTPYIRRGATTAAAAACLFLVSSALLRPTTSIPQYDNAVELADASIASNTARLNDILEEASRVREEGIRAAAGGSAMVEGADDYVVSDPVTARIKSRDPEVLKAESDELLMDVARALAQRRERQAQVASNALQEHVEVMLEAEKSAADDVAEMASRPRPASAPQPEERGAIESIILLALGARQASERELIARAEARSRRRLPHRLLPTEGTAHDVTTAIAASLAASADRARAMLEQAERARRVHGEEESETDYASLDQGPAQPAVALETSEEISALVQTALARAARADRAVLGRARTQPPAVGAARAVAELGLLRVIGRTSASERDFAADHQHNARILQGIAGVGARSTMPNVGPRGTPAVLAAQATANRWLVARGMTVHDLGTDAPEGAFCGTRLCEDGILGAGTKGVLLAIAVRDQEFWRPAVIRPADTRSRTSNRVTPR